MCINLLKVSNERKTKYTGQEGHSWCENLYKDDASPVTQIDWQENERNRKSDKIFPKVKTEKEAEIRKNNLLKKEYRGKWM